MEPHAEDSQDKLARDFEGTRLDTEADYDQFFAKCEECTRAVDRELESIAPGEVLAYERRLREFREQVELFKSNMMRQRERAALATAD